MKKEIKQIFLLSALIYFLQGIKNLPNQPLFYYFRETLHLSVSKIMYLTSITTLAWIIKPIYGFISDSFPIKGYRRKSYIFISALTSVILYLLLGSITLSLYFLIGLMLMESFAGAFRDVAIDGLMVEKGKKFNITGKVQSVQWGFLTVAGLITGITGGYISQHFSYKVAYLLLLPFPIMILIASFYTSEAIYINKKRRFLKTVTSSSLSLLKLFKDKNFAMSSLFLFLLWLSPAIGTPYMNKLRYDLHLSKIMIGWIYTLPSISAIIGAILYYKVSQKINLKKWLYISTIISALSTLAYLYLTIKLVFIYAFAFGLSGMFTHLLVMDFMARTCKKGNEATIFAMLCSLVNFAGWLSVLIGARLYTLVHFNGLIIISALFTLGCLLVIPKIKV